ALPVQFRARAVRPRAAARAPRPAQGRGQADGEGAPADPRPPDPAHADLHQEQVHAGRGVLHARRGDRAIALAPRPLRHRDAQVGRAAAALCGADLLAPGLHRGAHALREGDAPLMSAISTKPYLIRAIHEWCTDSGYRPYIAVTVDEHTIVPREFVRGGEIVLNVSPAATNRLRIGNDLIEF